MAAAKKTTPDAGAMIMVRPLNLQWLNLRIEGDSALIMHKWSQKAQQEMLDVQQGNKKKVRDVRNPDRDYWESIYHFDEKQEATFGHRKGNRYGFPAVAFKCAMVTAVTSVSQMTKVMARQVLWIQPDFGDFIEIEGAPSPRLDMVRVGMGTADLRYRGEFKKWSSTLKIKFNADVISAASLVHLLDLAGFGVGIGEWRSEKDGIYGGFHVAKQVVDGLNVDQDEAA
jgi:hypothetical protein